MDLRVNHIFWEQMKDDKSFKEEKTFLSLIFGQKKYTTSEMRDIWHKGIKYGIEIGLNKASVEGQKLELSDNTITPKHKEFLKKFYALADEYGCCIQYHPKFGMVICENSSNAYQPK